MLGRDPADLQTDTNIDYLRKSRLARSELDISDVELIADLLASNRNVVQLDLSTNGFGPGGIPALIRIVQSCTTLSHLASGRNNLRLGVAELAEAIASNTTLRRLDLPANAVNAATVDRTAAALSCNTTLSSLNISWNPFGPDGGAAMATLLGANTELRSLDLAGCAIRRDGTCAVAAALEVSSSKLQQLDLSENFVGREGAVRAPAGAWRARAPPAVRPPAGLSARSRPPRRSPSPRCCSATRPSRASTSPATGAPLPAPRRSPPRATPPAPRTAVPGSP